MPQDPKAILMQLIVSGMQKIQSGQQPTPDEIQAIQLFSQQSKGLPNGMPTPPPPQQRVGAGPVPPNPNNLLATQAKPYPRRPMIGPNSPNQFSGGVGSD